MRTSAARAVLARPAARVTTALILATVLAVAVPEAVPQLSATPAEAAPAHPFSDPRWYPLRHSDMDFWRSMPRKTTTRYSSLVACVKTNCGFKHNDPHGYWAIDFVGDYGDPVYAAGAGRLHVESRNGGCSTGNGGTWAWIDHGGGVVSRYHHLARIVASDGQWVTPKTQIATLGPGDPSCGVHYLHFEVRRGGLRGRRYNPGQLRACRGERRVAFPRSLDRDFTTWDDVPYRDRSGAVPAVHSRCAPSMPSTPNRPAWTRVRSRYRSATVSWPRPSRPANRITVELRRYHPSAGSYGTPTYRSLPRGTRRTTLRGLDSGRLYRVRVAFHNATGYSTWGPRDKFRPR